MKYKLSLEDDEYDFEGWAFLHFHTTAPGYAFADSLNRLYDYRLERIDDMMVDEMPWPLYRYVDGMLHHFYFLVERPAAASAAPWKQGDKVLIVKGENAEAEVRRIYADFVGNMDVDETDLVAREHAALLADLLSDFTLATVLDFSDPSPTRMYKTMQHYCDLILDHIERKHLDLSDEEKMRLDMLKRL